MRITRVLTTVDTHTAGGPTRIITGGLPPIPGDTVAAKMDWFRQNLDDVRRLLLHEPRGHRDMYGAVVTESAREDADLGAFFLTAGGYLRACVHSSIGVAAAGLQTGFIPRPGPGAAIRMEVPAGVVALTPRWDGETLRAVTIRTPPAFVFDPAVRLDVDGRTVEAVVAYSGVFFLVARLDRLREAGLLAAGDDGAAPPLAPGDAPALAALGVRLLDVANRSVEVAHPEAAGTDRIALVILWDDADGPLHLRDIVVGPTGGIDRSPCGAGTAAMAAVLAGQGRLPPGTDFVVESFLGTRFTGRAVGPATVGPFEGVVPEVEGGAWITGTHQFVLDPDDPFPAGFHF